MYHWMTQAEIQRFLAHLRREERSPGPWPNTAGICWPLPPGCPKGAGGQGTGAGMEGGDGPAVCPQHGEQHDCGPQRLFLPFRAGTGAG